VMAGADIRGITIAGLGIIADGDARWVTLTGGTLVARSSAAGLVMGLYRVRSPSVTGISLSALQLRTIRLQGASVAAYNYVREQRGLSIGVFNDARRLHGVQIGLLNRAGNNPRATRWLPLVNAHF
jgi:hypothetical protein